MIKLKKVNYNLILGVLLGFILAEIVIFEGYAVIAGMEQNIELIGAGLTSNIIMKRFQALSAIVFILTVLIFNSKKFKRINMDRISIYLILVILVSIVVAAQGTMFICWIIFKIYPYMQIWINKNDFILLNIAFLTVFMGIALFLITFVLLVNRKVSYIKFLTKEVKIIKMMDSAKQLK